MLSEMVPFKRWQKQKRKWSCYSSPSESPQFHLLTSKYSTPFAENQEQKNGVHVAFESFDTISGTIDSLVESSSTFHRGAVFFIPESIWRGLTNPCASIARTLFPIWNQKSEHRNPYNSNSGNLFRPSPSVHQSSWKSSDFRNRSSGPPPSLKAQGCIPGLEY